MQQTKERRGLLVSSAAQNWLGALSLVLATLVVYPPALSGLFVWDDDSWTFNLSGLLRNVSGLGLMWCRPTALQQYYPLTGTTFWLDYQIWGIRPLPYHVGNVLLDACAALLFWRMLRRLQVPGAWPASAKNHPLPERREVARVAGIGALKYAALLPNRQGDYVFSWDKLPALNGNTAPDLQYAYARIRSIFRKGNVVTERGHSCPQQHPYARPADKNVRAPAAVELATPEELALARHRFNFGLVLEAVAEDYRPYFLCNYLYELAGRFTAFYENCPVLKAEASQRASRLVLSDLTAGVLKQGLDVLGIETLEQM